MSLHVPVLLREVLDALAQAQPEPDPEVLLDATFGGGGHSRALLERFSGYRLVAMDQDEAAVERAAVLEGDVEPGRFRFVAANFEEVGTLEESTFSGILFDLGLSSFQLDEAERGFSFRLGGPSDMRMDRRGGQTAADFLETASEEELVRAVREYGEEPQWRAVVRAILSARGTDTLSNTTSLAALVARTAHGGRRGRGPTIHPATRTFQGIRIAVNRELEVIETALPAAFEKLAPGGVLAVISFHSLEDRIVKRLFRRWAGRPEHGRDNRPQQERERRAELLGTKPVTPTEEETERNPRARSAKLRALRKVRK